MSDAISTADPDSWLNHQRVHASSNSTRNPQQTATRRLDWGAFRVELEERHLLLAPSVGSRRLWQTLQLPAQRGLVPRLPPQDQSVSSCQNHRPYIDMLDTVETSLRQRRIIVVKVHFQLSNIKCHSRKVSRRSSWMYTNSTVSRDLTWATTIWTPACEVIFTKTEAIDVNKPMKDLGVHYQHAFLHKRSTFVSTQLPVCLPKRVKSSKSCNHIQQAAPPND